eukprot:GHVT01047428.1.p1 GENE.GHVT01047428.1~~GHVT01047428.1.p1  ORF type:complete len:112 (+),score=0.74 GHVT01047428.1:114-449(+)
MAFKSPTGPLNLWDLAATLCLGTVMAILSEGVTWCFVYRHPECQHHHKELVKLWRKTQRPPGMSLSLPSPQSPTLHNHWRTLSLKIVFFSIMERFRLVCLFRMCAIPKLSR